MTNIKDFYPTSLHGMTEGVDSYVSEILDYLQHLDADTLSKSLEAHIVHEWVNRRDPSDDWFCKEFVPYFDHYQEPNWYYVKETGIEDSYLGQFCEERAVRCWGEDYNEITDTHEAERLAQFWRESILNEYSPFEHLRCIARTLVGDLIRHNYQQIHSGTPTGVKTDDICELVRNKLSSAFSLSSSIQIDEFLRYGVRYKGPIEGWSVSVIGQSDSGYFAYITRYGDTKKAGSIKNLEIDKVYDPAFRKEYTVNAIASGSFDSLSELESITIGSDINNIEWGYWHCHKLKGIYVNAGNKKYRTNDGVLFSKDEKTLYAYPNAHGDTYIVPEGVEKIAPKAFKDCISLMSLTLPSSLKEIGINSFYGCTNLKDIDCANMPDFKYHGIWGAAKHIDPTIHFPSGSVKLSEYKSLFREDAERV